MKPFKKFSLISLFVLLSVLIALFLYYFLSPERPKPLFSLGFVQLPSDFSIHFTKRGIAVSIPHTVFYSPDGLEIEPPFAVDDFINLPLGFSINRSTDNFFLINERYIFSTSESPFKMVWKSDDKLIWDMVEVNNSLLLILKDENNGLVPYILDLTSYELTILQGLLGTYYLDAATCEEFGSFSVLSLSDQGLFPSTRVFHYNSENALYSALSQADSLYFNIYRIGSTFILVGANRVICYNTYGSRQWQFDIPNAYRHSNVSAGKYLWIYFYNSSAGFSNALRISEDARKEWFNLPHGMSSLQSFPGGFMGVLNHSEVLIFNDQGNLAARFDPGIDIDKMFWDRDLPDYLYLLDRFDRLFAYAFKEPSTKEE